MDDQDRNDSQHEVEDQGAGEAEASEEQLAAMLRRRVKDVPQTTSASAPVDDDVIIK